MNNVDSRAIALHKQHQGKLAIVSKVPLAKADDLTLAYTPGVAAPCLAIQKEPELAYDYTSKGNTVAVVTDRKSVV